MRLSSIRVKLFSLIVGAFFCSTVAILLIADSELTEIIDTSKNAFYREKVDAIWNILQQHHERLKKTGLMEAYLPDFKSDTIKELKRSYYSQQHPAIYPFIIDTDGNVILHPVLLNNTAEPATRDFFKRFLAAERGDFNLAFGGERKHYTFRRFPQWQWVIAYAVPFEIKYAEARKFHTLLLLIMTGVTLCVLLLFIPVIARFTKPIIRLTIAARAMAEGDLDQKIIIQGNDEISSLAQSFQDMRAAIRQTIYELELENGERKKAEAALAHEKEQLAVTLISIGDGVITTDISGRILLMNKVAEELTGWHGTEVIDHTLEDVFCVINRQTGRPVKNMVDRIVTSGTMTSEERQEILVSKSGKEVTIAGNGAPIKDAEQNIIGVILVFRDISKQIKTEQELLKVRKLESIGVLAGGIAHDFNNILAIILGNINLSLMDAGLTDERIRKRLTNVEKTTLRAQRLTQQLLTFSKGGDPIKKVSSLENLIKEAAGFFLDSSKVAYQFDIPQDLWPAEIDKGQMSQVIQNILMNGCEAMPEGGKIVLSCRNILGEESENLRLGKGQRYVAISIADSGKGIPAADMDKIFDPYFSTKVDGNGLGLAICHSIVAKHDGYISVRSESDGGTIFTIYLPAHIPQAAPASTPSPIVPDTVQARVMIMDDEELVRDMVEIMLKEMGHTPFVAENGGEALELYKKNWEAGTPIDIVIMDLTIPGAMGGKEAVQELLAFDRNAKAIVCSGYSNDPVMADARGHGFRAAIVKPYTYQGLVEIIDKTLKES